LQIRLEEEEIFPPRIKLKALNEAINPVEQDSTYPSTPTICPAKKIRGSLAKFNPDVSNSGALMNVFR